LTPFGGTPIAGDIVFYPGVEFKPVEGDALLTDGDSCEKGPDLAIEAVAVHAQIRRRIAKSYEPR
jgi:hypothetical protein